MPKLIFDRAKECRASQMLSITRRVSDLMRGKATTLSLRTGTKV